MNDSLQSLSHLVWELRFLSIAAQTAHWRVFGPSSYSDHQLFGSVYEKLNDLLDPLAERLTAMSQFDDVKYVDPVAQARYVYKKMRKLGPALSQALNHADTTAAFFYEELLSLTRRFRGLSSDIKAGGFLSYGLDDLLAGTANDLETLVYFLERRSQLPGSSSSPPVSSPVGPAPVAPTMQMPPPALIFGPRGF